jgi:hypothetical protein
MADEFLEQDLDTPTEADLDSLYGSKYASAADVGDKKIRTRISKIRKEMMQQQGGKPERAKFVLYLASLEKPMVLNATNKNTLVEKLGKNPADWIGADIGILAENTTYAGKPVKGLRLRVLSPPKTAKPPTAKPKPAQRPAVTEAPPWPKRKVIRDRSLPKLPNNLATGLHRGHGAAPFNKPMP